MQPHFSSILRQTVKNSRFTALRYRIPEKSLCGSITCGYRYCRGKNGRRKTGIRNDELFEEADSEIADRRRHDMDERIAGEIVVFPAVDRPQEPAAGILIGGFIPGRDRHTDNFAVPVPVGDLSSVVDGAAAYPSMRIAVGGIAAVW